MSGFDGITFDDVIGIGKDLFASIFGASDDGAGESPLDQVCSWASALFDQPESKGVPADDSGTSSTSALTVADMLNRASVALTVAFNEPESEIAYKLIRVAEEWRMLAGTAAGLGRE